MISRYRAGRKAFILPAWGVKAKLGKASSRALDRNAKGSLVPVNFETSETARSNHQDLARFPRARMYDKFQGERVEFSAARELPREASECRETNGRVLATRREITVIGNRPIAFESRGTRALAGPAQVRRNRISRPRTERRCIPARAQNRPANCR